VLVEGVTEPQQHRRHGRTCSGHPRLASFGNEDVDARDERGHDEGAAPRPKNQFR
jgi:hypothetical protein